MRYVMVRPSHMKERARFSDTIERDNRLQAGAPSFAESAVLVFALGAKGGSRCRSRLTHSISDLHLASFTKIVTKAAPPPQLRRWHRAPLHWIAMNIAQ